MENTFRIMKSTPHLCTYIAFCCFLHFTTISHHQPWNAFIFIQIKDTFNLMHHGEYEIERNVTFVSIHCGLGEDTYEHFHDATLL